MFVRSNSFSLKLTPSCGNIMKAVRFKNVLRRPSSSYQGIPPHSILLWSLHARSDSAWRQLGYLSMYLLPSLPRSLSRASHLIMILRPRSIKRAFQLLQSLPPSIHSFIPFALERQHVVESLTLVDCGIWMAITESWINMAPYSTRLYRTEAQKERNQVEYQQKNCFNW